MKKIWTWFIIYLFDKKLFYESMLDYQSGDFPIFILQLSLFIFFAGVILYLIALSFKLLDKYIVVPIKNGPKKWTQKFFFRKIVNHIFLWDAIFHVRYIGEISSLKNNLILKILLCSNVYYYYVFSLYILFFIKIYP